MSFKMFAPGRLTRDIESITTPKGTVIYKGGIAGDFGYGDKKDTLFLDFVAFGKTGEIIAEYHEKGDPIILEGEFQVDKWEDKEGKKHERYKLKVEGFQFSAGKKKKEAAPKDEPVEEFEAGKALPF